MRQQLPPFSTNSWTDVGWPNSKPGLSRVAFLFSPSPGWCCLPVRTSHNEAVSDFTHQSLGCIRMAQTDARTHAQWRVWKHTDSCEHKHMHTYSCGNALDEWAFSLFLIHCQFLSPTGLWLKLSISVVKVDLINVPCDRHTASHTHALFGSEQVNFLTNCKRWHLLVLCVCTCTHLPFCRGGHLAFGYWVFAVHDYFSSVIYNSISSVHWCASYLQNTKQSPNPIVFQSN